jgi:hypothetical protein
MLTRSLPRGYVMDRVTVDLENCYGIKKLSHVFDFKKTRAYALYAPNGIMKSSLARTFHDVAEEAESSDRIFKSRKTRRSITDEAGNELSSDQILVVEPYNEALGLSEKCSTLLVDAKLREEYSKLHVEINKAQDALLAALKKQAGSKRDFEEEIISTFAPGEELQIALTRIKAALEKQRDTPFANAQYDKIFDERVLETINEKGLSAAIEDYVTRYNELLAKSNFFKRGTFDYYNATEIATSLTKNGFFSAKHTVRLNANGESIEVRNKAELEAIITKEKNQILNDPKLLKKFDEIATALDKNVTLRTFRSYMQDHPALLSQMNNVPRFKGNVLKSYLKANFETYQKLMECYEAAEKRSKEIIEEAERQRTRWERVIDIFNERFVVPFKLETKNRNAVLLGQEEIVELDFIYHEGNDQTKVEREELLQALSTGEKKAFYILNVIFEIEGRQKQKQETLIVIDDLADSFDYQNKYAIIQYLKDISENDDGLFKQIIMTHNFDFFRTVESRFVGYKQCLMASRDANKTLTLNKALGIRNVFVKDWKKNFYSDPMKKLACVPFLRNLVEYTEGEGDPKYAKLTSILHWRADSAGITVKDLDAIFNEVCHGTSNSADQGKAIPDLITEQAEQCLAAPVGTNFENKIVLAIATRLRAERFMVGKINDPSFVASIDENQSHKLAQKFKEKFSGEIKNVDILDRVLLMTPENLHLNSFMYEPIVDMSDEALKKLYRDVKRLA